MMSCQLKYVLKARLLSKSGHMVAYDERQSYKTNDSRLDQPIRELNDRSDVSGKNDSFK